MGLTNSVAKAAFGRADNIRATFIDWPLIAISGVLLYRKTFDRADDDNSIGDFLLDDIPGAIEEMLAITILAYFAMRAGVAQRVEAMF